MTVIGTCGNAIKTLGIALDESAGGASDGSFHCLADRPLHLRLLHLRTFYMQRPVPSPRHAPTITHVHQRECMQSSIMLDCMQAGAAIKARISSTRCRNLRNRRVKRLTMPQGVTDSRETQAGDACDMVKWYLWTSLSRG